MITFKTERKEEIKNALWCRFKNHDQDKHFKELYEFGKKISYNSDFKERLTYFNALGNEERLKIIELLKLRARCVVELETALDKSQSSVSHHIRILEAAGLIKGWKRGKFTFYQLEKKRFIHFLNLLNNHFNFTKKD